MGLFFSKYLRKNARQGKREEEEFLDFPSFPLHLCVRFDTSMVLLNIFSSASIVILMPFVHNWLRYIHLQLKTIEKLFPKMLKVCSWNIIIIIMIWEENLSLHRWGRENWFNRLKRTSTRFRVQHQSFENKQYFNSSSENYFGSIESSSWHDGGRLSSSKKLAQGDQRGFLDRAFENAAAIDEEPVLWSNRSFISKETLIS